MDIKDENDIGQLWYVDQSVLDQIKEYLSSDPNLDGLNNAFFDLDYRKELLNATLSML